MKNYLDKFLVAEESDCCHAECHIQLDENAKIFWICNNCKNIVKHVLWKAMQPTQIFGGKK